MDDKTKYSQFDIYLPDFWTRIKMSWKRYILLVILFVIIFCGYGVYRGYKTADTITIQLTAEEQISSIQNQVNEMSRQRQLNYLAYLNSAEAVYEKKEYIANSQLMQLDANNVYQSNILYNTAQFDGMSDGELFSCDIVFSDDEIKTIISKQKNSVSDEQILDTVYVERFGNVLMIEVFSGDEQQSKDLASTIKEILDERYGEGELRLENGYSSDLAKLQEEQIKSLGNLSASMSTTSNSISDDDKKLANQYLSLVINNQDNIDEEIIEDIQKNVLSYISLKNIFIGILGGLFISLFYDAIFLLIGSKVYNKYTAETELRVDTLAELDADAKSFEYNVLSKQVSSYIKSINGNCIGLIENCEEKCIEFSKNLKKDFANDEVDVIDICLSNMSNEVLDSFDKFDVVVYIVNLNNCARKDLRNMKSFANKFSNNLLGTVIVK